MKVKEAIKELKELDQDEQIIIAWWERDSFDLKKKNWNHAVGYVDSDFDWSATHDDLQQFILSFFFDKK
jgi:hypothetical protein